MIGIVVDSSMSAQVGSWFADHSGRRVLANPGPQTPEEPIPDGRLPCRPRAGEPDRQARPIEASDCGCYSTAYIRPSVPEKKSVPSASAGLEPTPRPPTSRNHSSTPSVEIA